MLEPEEVGLILTLGRCDWKCLSRQIILFAVLGRHPRAAPLTVPRLHLGARVARVQVCVPDPAFGFVVVGATTILEGASAACSSLNQFSFDGGLRLVSPCACRQLFLLQIDGVSHDSIKIHRGSEGRRIDIVGLPQVGSEIIELDTEASQEDLGEQMLLKPEAGSRHVCRLLEPEVI